MGRTPYARGLGEKREKKIAIMISCMPIYPKSPNNCYGEGTEPLQQINFAQTKQVKFAFLSFSLPVSVSVLPHQPFSS